MFVGISFKLFLWGILSMNRIRVNLYGRKGSGLRDVFGGEKVSFFFEVWCGLFVVYIVSRGVECFGLVMRI